MLFEDASNGDRVEERDEDEETGMDEGCLDADTSGDECERMSLSGNHPPASAGYFMEDASALAGSSQGGTTSTNAFLETQSDSVFRSQKNDRGNTIFGMEGPPPIPAGQKNVSNKEASAKTKMEFRPQYDTIRAAKIRQFNTGKLGSLGDFSRVADAELKMQGFDIKGDTRQFVAKNFHDTTGGRNISASVDPEGFDCLVCEKKHNIGESIEVGSPVAVVISDQNFPAVLPTDDGNCAVVIRVEDGRLFEIEKVFSDIFKKFLAPSGGLPVGSVVLVGSLAHLARFGLESYTTDLVKTISSMRALVGGGGGRDTLCPYSVGRGDGSGPG